MAARKKFTSELRDFISQTLYLTIALEACNVALQWYFKVNLDYSWPLLAGPGITAFRHVGSHLPKRKMSFASLAPVFSDEGDIESYIMKWKDNPVARHEFRFSGYGLPVVIPGSKFDRFVRLAWRRQMNAIHGSMINLMWDTSFTNNQPRLKQLTANQVLSARYYMRSTQPRFIWEEYRGCIMILERCRLLDGRRQGRAGLLLYEPTKTVAIAESTWYSPTPRRGLFNFPKISTTS